MNMTNENEKEILYLEYQLLKMYSSRYGLDILNKKEFDILTEEEKEKKVIVTRTYQNKKYNMIASEDDILTIIRTLKENA
jgi:hypothetical protein